MTMAADFSSTIGPRGVASAPEESMRSAASPVAPGTRARVPSNDILRGSAEVEILSCDLKAEQASHKTLKDGIAHCETVRDYVSREVLEHILVDTEEHIDWLETQIGLVAQVGEQNWLQSQMDEGS